MTAERRKFHRDTAGVAAACRVRGIAYRARLSDVSHLGCCAELASQVALPGERVLVQLGRLMVLPATVRWVSGDKAGLEFANPLHGTMLSQFARRRGSSPAELH